MPEPLVRALVAHFDSVFVGPNGDYASVMEALAGVSAAQALWKPADGRNSIWQIVDHVTGSKQWQIEILEKGQAAAPVWTEPYGGEVEWQAALARLQDAHARLKRALEQLSDEALLKVPMPEWNQTLLELILSSGAAHDAHHSGQIDYLKGLQAKETHLP